MVPWFERPIIYDVRARPSLIQSTSGSKDLQMASCDQVVQRVGVTPGVLCCCILSVHISGLVLLHLDCVHASLDWYGQLHVV